MVELLAPAGTWEAFVAAVENGANAVYLAGKNFGARAYADNFDEETLPKAVHYAHLHSVAIHVTVNTVVDDSELADLKKYLLYLYNTEVDAIIVQDLGVAALAHSLVPNLTLHASTQMSVNTLEGVQMLAKLGFKRVVLARETSLEDIKYICQNSPIEIETFIHGAICVCYSGECLMSSLIGGRSGNRGRCAQPCRLPYELVNEKGENLLAGTDAGHYLLSPRDLKTIELIPELIEAGVTSFKIEGRMKKPEYVAIVVQNYRKAIDDYLKQKPFPLEQANKELSQIFNRDFTTAYLKRHLGKNMISDKRPNNRGLLVGRVLSYNPRQQLAEIKLSEALSIGDKLDFWVKVGGRVNTDITKIFYHEKPVKEARAGQTVYVPLDQAVHPHDRVFKILDAKLWQKAHAFQETTGIPLSMHITAQVNKPLQLQLIDEQGNQVTVTSDFIVPLALKRATTEADVHKQLNRLGNSGYFLKKLICSLSADIMLPASVLNKLRRDGIDKLNDLRLQNYHHAHIDHTDKFYQLRKRTLPLPKRAELVVCVDTLEKAKTALQNGAPHLLLHLASYHHRMLTLAECRSIVELAQAKHVPLSLALPRILNVRQQTFLFQFLEKLLVFPFQTIYAQTLAQIKLCRQFSHPIWADTSLNVFNNAAIDALQTENISGIVLSPELNLNQLKNIIRHTDLPMECLVYGNLELMISEYCSIGSFLGELDTGKCKMPCDKGHYFFKDRKGEKFPLVTDQFCHMYVLNGRELNMLNHLPQLQQAGLSRLRLDARYINAKRLPELITAYESVLKGGNSYLKNNKQIIEKIIGPNYTRGHFFRGVIDKDTDKNI